MTPLQIASVIVLVTFVALLVAGTGTARAGAGRRRSARHAAARGRLGRASPATTAPEASDFRADALAAAEDPIAGQTTERSRA